MALYTPLARLGTFLFPSQSRRISAPPPPESPHEPAKRRSAVAACDSPPRCRRRLSFADTDVVIEYAQSPGDSTSALNALVVSFPELPPERRAAAWREIAQLAGTRASSAGLEDSALRALFLQVFGKRAGAAGAEGVAEELEAAAVALDSVLSAASRPLAARDEELVALVLRAAWRHVDNAGFVEAVAALVLRHDWGLVFGEAVHGESERLSRAILEELRNEQVELDTWEALLQLLSVCAEVETRYRQEAAGQYVERPGMAISCADAAAVLASFDRLADRDEACTASALRALAPLFVNRRVAATFAMANGSAIFSEVSAIHAQKLSVQHACIDLLVWMSSPKTLREDASL